MTAADVKHDPDAASRDIDQLAINTIRTLAIDAVQKADSGHAGAMAARADANLVQPWRVCFHPSGSKPARPCRAATS